MLLVRMVKKLPMEGLPVLSHFPRFSPNESRPLSESAVRDCSSCLRKPERMIWWNRAKRSWASDGSPSAPSPAQVLGHWQWRLLFSWRVTWKNDFSESLPRGANQRLDSELSKSSNTSWDVLSLLSLQGRWAGVRRAASLSAFRDSIEGF